MQCKHIPDERVIRAILETRGMMGVGEILDNWRRWEFVWQALDRQMSMHIPWGLFWAKINGMNKRGVIDACWHERNSGQCAGRIHLASECRDNNGSICGA